MDSLYVLIPIALLFVVIAVAVFFFAVKSDQFEDLERHGMNILLDDDSRTKPQSEEDKEHRKGANVDTNER
ncbi:cbb3-type cytochrome oxidase assembly protein CcoS [Pseudidiomarina marina]|uniref:Cbb3-type cytochrome oxidase assembly protein CcoS n=1 Tax=Pseudidiomarina marina TaxID=502366 RepID=A0A432YJT1_9GAMM|nr:cbb3-type cytochrome oxidase assembly protein CcoS [Pseudidiomarina marina]PHR66950.1 MAG: cbb3-type cytochrome oxidase assembly protein CcoS [Idiomarina sp.]RUO61214.1 cbb3-type cytochrome oxidase assembly protein CcoS [Pseudidiomarina marina]